MISNTFAALSFSARHSPAARALKQFRVLKIIHGTGTGETFIFTQGKRRRWFREQTYCNEKGRLYLRKVGFGLVMVQCLE